MKKLIIIIPYCNSPKLLKKLLDTIPKIESIQTIVVDDKSDKYIKDYNEIKNSICYSHILFTQNSVNKKKYRGI